MKILKCVVITELQTQYGLLYRITGGGSTCEPMTRDILLGELAALFSVGKRRSRARLKKIGKSI